MSNFHFISGLPRAGTKLLAGILRKNPQFHASMTSPVAAMMNSELEQMGADSTVLDPITAVGNAGTFCATGALM